jgi:polyketide synthase 12
MDLGTAELDILAIQLTAALDGPLVLYLSASDFSEEASLMVKRIAHSWQDLVQRVCQP